MEYSIKFLCNRFKVSRSTLLYYDQIGLLKASNRTTSNFRKYSEEDVKRMEQICIYRQAGLPLEDIKKILYSSDSITSSILEKRLDEINEEVQGLRNQQHYIIKILKNDELLKRVRVISLDTWIKLLNSIGFDKIAMEKWHVEFEKSFPDEHQLFLESLGLSSQDIKEIRTKSQNSLNL